MSILSHIKEQENKEKIDHNLSVAIDLFSIAGYILKFSKEYGFSVIMDDTVLVASETDLMEEVHDISNGRIEIFMEYIKHWNLTGHEQMQFECPNGTTPAHAHNTFLQVIHDHGLIVGVLFVIFGILSFFLSIRRCCMANYRNQEEYYDLLPIAVILAFAAAGMVEWIFHFSNPFGFAIFIVIVPLLFVQKQNAK